MLLRAFAVTPAEYTRTFAKNPGQEYGIKPPK